MKLRLIVFLVYTGMYATSFSQSVQEQMIRLCWRMSPAMCLLLTYLRLS